MYTRNFHWTDIDNNGQRKPTWVALESVNHAVNWLPISESSLFEEDLLDEDMLEEDGKDDNDKTGREFEWKIVKKLMELAGKELPEDFDPNHYSEGTLVPDDHIKEAASAIVSEILNGNPSKIENVQQIGSVNGTSHGDVLITTKSGDIGVELKYVKDGQGTWHNTKGSLLNRYLENKDFYSPDDVLMNNKPEDIFTLEGNLKFGNPRKNYKNHILAIMEPFASNGINLMSNVDSEEERGWSGLVSIQTSHNFRHGVKQDGSNMDKIVISFNEKKKAWCANGEQLKYQDFWNINPKKKFTITSNDVYKKIFKPIGNIVMREVVSNHMDLLKSNPDYVNKLFQAMLCKITSKELVSKLPDYVVAFRKTKNYCKVIDCSPFKDSQITNVKFTPIRIKFTDAEDQQKLDELNINTPMKKTMGYWLTSKELNVQFKVQYYWKNGTGLANPVIIGFIYF